jgi:hypothetical protein
MDRDEAKLILSALRPDGAEVHEPIFAEALALLETDPELRDWWQAQQKFDRKIAAKLSEVPVPEDLRDRILASPKIEAFPPQWRHRSLLAAAALIAILCVAISFWNVASNDGLDRTAFADAALNELNGSGPLLAMQSSDRDKVKAWLQEQNAPIGDMPGKIASIPPYGCQKYIIHGHTVSLICLALANGGIAHLFVVDKGALTNPPGTNGPHYDRMNGWNIATWSDNRMSYMLATQSSLNDLKQLFSAG